jgi:hypothetical protein
MRFLVFRPQWVKADGASNFAGSITCFDFRVPSFLHGVTSSVLMPSSGVKTDEA